MSIKIGHLKSATFNQMLLLLPKQSNICGHTKGYEKFSESVTSLFSVFSHFKSVYICRAPCDVLKHKYMNNNQLE